jgi:hypothetical protein
LAYFEHGLRFSSLDDAVAYARRCLARGYDQTGNWDLAQTCRHMSDWLRAPLDGLPKMSLLMKLTMGMLSRTSGPVMVRRFLSDRRLAAGMGTLNSTVHPPEADATAAVEEFATVAARFTAHKGPWLRPSPLVVNLDPKQTMELQIVHCMHHFGRLKTRN